MRLSRYAEFSPLIAFVVLVGLVFLFDRERMTREERRAQEAQRQAENHASALANEVGSAVAGRMGGATTAMRVRYTSVEDSISERTFMAALDSATAGVAGLNAVQVVDPDNERILGRSQGLGARLSLRDTTVYPAYLRALTGRRQAATNIISYGYGARVIVFDPIMTADSSRVLGVLAAELDPFVIYRVAASSGVVDTVRGTPLNHSLWGPGGVRLSSMQPMAPGMETVSRPVRVADTEWHVRVAYLPPDPREGRAERWATWIAGLAFAIAASLILHFLRRTIATQKEEIARRQAAEEAARTAAAEARERAKQARDLAAQLEAAQRASQRLSTSLDPDDVVELFLGGVAEILDADVASLYTFEEEGELLVGRRRMVFREIDGVTDRLKQEDIRQVRAPVSLLPALAEAVSTGEPYILENADDEGRLITARPVTAETASASVTVPLLIAGHTVGVAQWEVYSGPRRFPPAIIAFAQALAAPAAAALRTAELFLSLELERQRASREALRFGAVLDQMADGVIVVDGQGTLERSNAAAEELLGEELAETKVNDWPVRFDIVSAEGRPMGAAEFPLTRSLRGEQVRRATFIVRNDWGTERHLSGSSGPIIGPSGEPGGAAMVVRDVTDEHQYAEMLRHTNRELRRQAEVLEQVNHQLREATKAKDQFLAVMSHELRTPINAIMGYSDLLDLGVKGPLNDDQRAMLSRVRETSRHLLGLINEVLDLAKIGAGRMDLVMVELDAGQMLERAVQQIMPLAAAKGLSLVVEEPAHRPVLVRGDETRLTQIFVNLLSNAVKFTAVGGVTVSYGEEEGDVFIRVADTGPGIPPDHVERIFEEFYQVEGGLSRSSGGTGLGLAIARRFARLMAGDITVRSEVGKGAEFTLRLPGASSAATEEEQEAGTTAVVLTHNQQALERLGEDLSPSVAVLGGTDPAAVAALARRERPQLIALDTRAPEHGAWRAIGALQAEPATALVPMLLYAHDDEPGETSLDLGTVHVLSKPIAIERVAHLVLGRGLGSPCSVLIGDDDGDVRRILGEALTAAGCEVRTAASGGELLDIARRWTPSVAIIDLLMPGVDGIEAIAMMRADRALQDVRIVALVSREMAEEEMGRLSASVESVGRGRRARLGATADLVRAAAERNGTGAAVA